MNWLATKIRQALVAVWMGGCLTAAAAEPTSARVAPGTAAMREELQKVFRQTDPARDEFR
jgi:hypothetical protein